MSTPRVPGLGGYYAWIDRKTEALEGRVAAREQARLGTATQVVKTVRGHEKALQSEVKKMAKQGFKVESINGRKAEFSAAAGVFTRKQVWTIVFEKVAGAEG